MNSGKSLTREINTCITVKIIKLSVHAQFVFFYCIVYRNINNPLMKFTLHDLIYCIQAEWVVFRYFILHKVKTIMASVVLWLFLVNYFYWPGSVGFSWHGFGKDGRMFFIKFVSISNFFRINCWLLSKMSTFFSMLFSRLIGESNWFCNDKININDTYITLKPNFLNRTAGIRIILQVFLY